MNQNRTCFQILIEGVRGASYTGDIAIDDLEINQESCTVNPPSAAVETKPPQPITGTL